MSLQTLEPNNFLRGEIYFNLKLHLFSPKVPYLRLKETRLPESILNYTNLPVYGRFIQESDIYAYIRLTKFGA